MSSRLTHGEELPNPVVDAIKALTRGLGYGAEDAKAQVQRLLQVHPDRSWEASELVTAVLRPPSSG